MSYAEPTSGPAGARTEGHASSGERLSLGVAARLSRYLQVLTQAKKMGKETISSQELSDYTHVNSTQIRRDLSGFGKFGKRGVGYNVEALVSQIRKILRTAGQHNIALLGAGHLGKAIASSDIFADHGFRVVAIFDVDDAKVGTQRGQPDWCATPTSCARSWRTRTSWWACWRCPRTPPRGSRTSWCEAGVKIIFNYSESLLARAAGGDRPHLQPGRRSALRAVLLSDLRPLRSRSGRVTLSSANAPTADPLRHDQPGPRPSGRDVRRGSPTSRSAWRRSSRSSTRRRSISCRASRSCALPPRAIGFCTRASPAS